jgi:hypothetical protein
MIYPTRDPIRLLGQVYGGYEAAFWAQEQELHVRVMEAYSGLVADVQRYHGFPREEQARMLHDDALVLTDQRQKKAAATLIAMDRVNPLCSFLYS